MPQLCNIGVRRKSIFPGGRALGKTVSFNNFSYLCEPPKLGPAIICRPRVHQWLLRHADVPLRLLAAPTGCGKTVACVNYLRGTATRVAYCRVPKNATTNDFLQILGRIIARGSGLEDYAAAINALRKIGRFELIFDDVEEASPEVLLWLERLIEDAPDDVTFVYAAPSRYIFDTTSMLARGVAVLCDAGTLAFTADEAAQLAAKMSLPCTDAAVGRLLFETEGWAVALAGAIRESVASDCSLDLAYEAWRQKEGRRFAEFIEHDLARVSPPDREALSRLMWGVAIEPQRGARLEGLGLPVRYVNGEYRVYRVLTRLQSRKSAMGEATAVRRTAPLLSVQMFGQFRATIDGKVVPWIRRRDQQLFKYLILQPEQRCPRIELIRRFWADADHVLGLQSLRTACSNIRKALASLVGRDAAEEYLSVGREIALNPDTVSVDVRRFVAHVNEGNTAYENGDANAALGHFRSAQNLYGGPLCDDDSLFAPYASMYESMLTLSVSRIRELVGQGYDAERRGEPKSEGVILTAFGQ